MPVGGSAGDAQGAGRFVHGHAGEQAKLDDLGRRRIVLGEATERIIQGDDLVRSRAGQPIPFRQLDPLPPSSVDLGSFSARAVDQDAPHGLGRGSKEVAAAVPVLGLVHVHQTEIRFVDQGCGLEGLAGLLAGEFLRSQAAQLTIDQGEKLLGHLGVALLDCREDPGHFGHGGRSSRAIRSYHGHDRPRNAIAPAGQRQDRHEARTTILQDKPGGHNMIGGRRVRSSDVAFIDMLAGTGLPDDLILMLQGRFIAKVMCASEKDLDQQKDLQKRLFGIMKTGTDSKKARIAMLSGIG